MESALFLAMSVAAALADTCDAYGAAEPLGDFAFAGLSEASGVVASRVRDGVYYTHGDDGPATLYAFDRGGPLDTVAVIGADLDDWEDLAAAPCPDKGDCLYLGDIGDNDATRAAIEVLVVREPEAGDTETKVRERYAGVYPDGPHDAEALLVHPCTGRIHVVTKDDDGLSTVYRFPPLAELTAEAATLEQVTRLQIDGPTAEARRVTGGDFDLDGDRAVLRTATQLLEWTIDPAAPNAAWSQAPNVIAAAAVEQGEGVAFTLAGGFVTTAEGAPTPVAEVACEAPVASDHACDFPQAGCGCAAAPSGPLGLWLGLATLLGVAQRRQRPMADQPS